MLVRVCSWVLSTRGRGGLCVGGGSCINFIGNRQKQYDMKTTNKNEAKLRSCIYKKRRALSCRNKTKRIPL